MSVHFDSSKPFCSLPWSSLCLWSDGSLRACCRANHATIKFDPDTFIGKGIENAWNSNYFKIIRLAFVKGQVPAVCSGCSKLYFPRHKDKCFQYSPEECFRSTSVDGAAPLRIVQAEVRLTDHCKFRCLTCNPILSSSWQKLYGRKSKSSPSWLSQSVLSELASVLVDCKQLTLTGGEPLLAESHNIFLHQLLNNDKQPSLFYNTSGVGISKHKIELWRRFPHVRIHVSIDGPPEVNDYIRGEKAYIHAISALGVDFPRTVSLGVECTVSALNVLRIADLVSYLDMDDRVPADIKLSFHHLRMPEFLSLSALPSALKERSIIKMEGLGISGLTNMIQVLKSINYDAAKSKEFIKYLMRTDDKRGSDHSVLFTDSEKRQLKWISN